MLRRYLSLGLSMGMLTTCLAVLGMGCKDDPVVVLPPPPPPRQMYTEWVHLPVFMEFPTDDDDLNAEQRAILREVVNTTRARTDVRRIRIEGHTDNRGDASYNHDLGQRRAQDVLEELVRLGVDRGLLEATSFGETQPRTDCSTPQDCLINRRVEFSVLVETPVQ